MKPKQLVSHGNTHKLGDKCKLCDRVKREVSMEDIKKLNTLTTRKQRVNLNMTPSRKPNKDSKHTSDSKQWEEQREEQMENKILIDCFNPNEQTLDMPKLLNLITDAINQAVDDEQKRMTEVMLNNSKPFFDSGYEQADKKWRRRAELLIQAVKGKSLWERSYVESLATLLEEV